jgi:hypothetical protein
MGSIAKDNGPHQGIGYDGLQHRNAKSLVGGSGGDFKPYQGHNVAGSRSKMDGRSAGSAGNVISRCQGAYLREIRVGARSPDCVG